MDLKETDTLGDDISYHWYYSSKAKAMIRMLKDVAPTSILDVGAGSGFFSRHLLTHTAAREACCVDINYKLDSDETEAGKAIRFRRLVDTIDSDLVLMMDVLEHVQDDVALLNEYVQKVPYGSRFLITVPAFSCLWSEHDEFLGHMRRYTLKQLETSVRDASLVVNHGAYYFGMVFPIAATLRLAQKIISDGNDPRSQLSRQHPVTNSILKTLCDLELHFMEYNKIAGLTAFCMATKV